MANYNNHSRVCHTHTTVKAGSKKEGDNLKLCPFCGSKPYTYNTKPHLSDEDNRYGCISGCVDDMSFEEWNIRWEEV